MTERRGSRDVVWIGLLTGLFALLCINVVVGVTKGYAHPSGGPLVVLLAAPGVALGWGGVALLLVAIPYALLTWRHGRGPGKVLAVLGALVFAFGVGGIAGSLSSPPAFGGGRLAGGLAALLKDAIGPGLAAGLLGLVAVPGLLLALAPLVLETGAVRAIERAKTGRGAAPWYPQRRVGPDGEELPPDFTGASDVGGIRFREPDPAPGAPPPAAEAPVSTVSLSPPSAVGPAPKKPKAIAGVRFADEALPDVGAAPPVAVGPEVRADALPSGVRYADSPPPHAPPVADDSEFATPAWRDGPRAAAATTPVAAPPAEPPPAEAHPAPPAPPTGDTAAEPAVASAPGSVAATVVAATAPAAPAPTPDATTHAVRPAAVAHPAVRAETATGVDLVPARAESPASLVADATRGERARSGDSYRRKLALTGLVDGGGSSSATAAPAAPAAASPATAPTGARPAPTTASANATPNPANAPARPPRPRPPKPSRPKDMNEAIRGLFSSLPIEELPPVQPAIDPPEVESEPRLEAPGQRTLFDEATATSSPRAPGSRHAGASDPLFGASVEAALERGSASLVLLKRKLGVGYARAASLMEALVEEGILGEMTASGSRPTLITAAEWGRRGGR